MSSARTSWQEQLLLLEHLQLRQLWDFVALVEEGSFTNAARRRQVSQPTLSSAVRQLERTLGGEVVERGRPVVPTRLGLAVLNHARRVAKVLNSLDDEVNASRMRSPRVIRAGVFAAGPGPITSRVLQAISTRRGLELSLAPVELDQQTSRVLDGTLDLVLTYGPFDDPRLRVTPLGDEPRVVAVGNRHPLMDAREVLAADILGFTMPTGVADIPPEWQRWWYLVPERNGELPRMVPMPADNADPVTQIRQATIRGLMAVVPRYLQYALPGPALGLHYVALADAAPATRIMITRVGAGPVIDTIVRMVEQLAKPSLPPTGASA